MKKKILTVLVLFTFAVVACKKDADTNQKSVYVEQGSKSGDIGFGGMMLELHADGRAGILYGGDVFYDGTYTMNANTIIVKQGKLTEKFKILSGNKLAYKNNRVLKLVKENQ